ncbi:MAG TPA: anti-sigma factor [Burkholderiales bacterium]|nr:anti-sigma factor [Burkholderiales bacterium]
MKLEESRALDALCGEYLLGTLQGAARRRFERALREEPRVALRLEHWRAMTPRYTPMIEVQPSADTWKRLERELGLGRYRTPWYRKVRVWQGIAGAATALLVLAIAPQFVRPVGTGTPSAVTIAQLEGKADAARVTAAVTSRRDVLELKAARPVLAGPSQSYELWLIPAEGGAPLSLAVLGTLDARIPVAPQNANRLVKGAKLAISVEPAGGSPTGGPTGPVIAIGEIAG